jgi:demethylmenaquinone methyltransferase / 2-methoxy-6-polyprenyl-1,4-benzoquinol methylase
MNDLELTHFGYQQVPAAEKSDRVAAVFHSVASNYDLMNDLMSGGLHRLWKQFAINVCQLRSSHRVLDIAGGTGDLAKNIAKVVGNTGQVVLADINASMLQAGRDRLLNEGIINNIEYIQADAECLPFSENNFDRVTIAFGLRNVTNKDKALASMYRVLKPGGSLIILEFSKPILSFLQKVYDAYSFHIIPQLGKWVTGDEDSYRYLVESIRMHPDQEQLSLMMENVGFETVSHFNLTGGIVAVHRGYKY